VTGFRLDDEECDEQPMVGEGQSSAAEPTLADEIPAFVDMCKQLLPLGAIEVKAGSLRARFK
jgi:hypothetical protein